MKNKLIVGNWKMNGGLRPNHALIEELLSGLPSGRACQVGVAVPSPYLSQVQHLIADSGIALAAQDVSEHLSGAFTGEVSATMLKDFGVRFVLVGHSERRQLHGETDASVARKAAQALGAGLTPIVCVGETLAEREAGHTQAVVHEQLAAVVDLIGAHIHDVVLAYEPIWAIGTGKTATPEQAQEVHSALRAQLAAATHKAGEMRILYGGSMNTKNAAALLSEQDIDGGLVGGASLKAPDFLSIIAAAHGACVQKNITE